MARTVDDDDLPVEDFEVDTAFLGAGMPRVQLLTRPLDCQQLCLQYAWPFETAGMGGRGLST